MLSSQGHARDVCHLVERSINGIDKPVLRRLDWAPLQLTSCRKNLLLAKNTSQNWPDKAENFAFGDRLPGTGKRLSTTCSSRLKPTTQRLPGLHTNSNNTQLLRRHRQREPFKVNYELITCQKRSTQFRLTHLVSGNKTSRSETLQ